MAITEGPERIGRPGSSRAGRRSAVVAALVVSALLVAACTPGKPSLSPTTGTSGTTGTTGTSGHYVGGGEQGSVSIAFDASSVGITKLQGTVLLICSQGNTPGLPYLVSSTIPLNGKSFSSDATTPLSNGNSQEINVAGSLDGSGHASGTLVYKLISGGSDVCDSGSHPIQWTASIGGAGSSPSSSTSSPSSSASSCSPQPCGSDGGVTLAVTALTAFPPKPDPSCPPAQCPPDTQVEMTFTVANGSSQDLLVSNSLYKLQPGNGQSIDNDGMGSSGYGGYLPDGHTCADNAADLQPGAHSDTLVACFSLTSAQLNQPLKLIWAYGLGAQTVGSTIDLSGLTMQTGPSL